MPTDVLMSARTHNQSCIYATDQHPKTAENLNADSMRSRISL